MKNDLIRRLKEIGILVQGDVVLKSGAHSNQYFDVKKAYGYSDILRAITELLWQDVDKRTTCIAASGYGGIVPASLISEKYGLHLALIRDSPKSHGLKRMIEGYFPNENDKVSIVDDVFSTGTNINNALGVLIPTKAEILSCHVVIKRGENNLSVPLHYIFTPEDLL